MVTLLHAAPLLKQVVPRIYLLSLSPITIGINGRPLFPSKLNLFLRTPICLIVHLRQLGRVLYVNAYRTMRVEQSLLDSEFGGDIVWLYFVVKSEIVIGAIRRQQTLLTVCLKEGFILFVSHGVIWVSHTSSVGLELFVSEYLRYFLGPTFCLKCNFVYLPARPAGTVCMTTYYDHNGFVRKFGLFRLLG